VAVPLRVFPARSFLMLATRTSLYIGMDLRSRRLRLAQLIALHPDLRVLGHAAVDQSCLRATITRRPHMLVLAPAADRAAVASHLIAAVRRGSPETQILALVDAEERPVSPPAGEVSAHRVLAEDASLEDVLRAVLDLASARRAREVTRRRRPGG
jgi:DNA-binding NarL/FixJ family response regulator